MAITGKFIADFSQFSDAVNQAETRLKSFETESNKVERALARMGDAFSGRKVIQDATLMTKAITDIGGVSKLTGDELQRAGSKASEAAEKMRAMGVTVPPELQRIADAAQKAREQEARLADEAKRAEQALRDQANVPPPAGFDKFFSDVTKQVAAMATGFVSGQAVIGLFSKGVHLAEDALRGLAQFMGESVQSFAAAEAAQKKLTTALVAQGTATPEVVSAYGDLSAAMQRTTVFSDDLTTEMQALLVQVGDVMPGQMERALSASADLAAGLGVDLQTATTLVAKAAAGHTETLGRYGITVDKAALATQGFSAVLDAINSQFGGQAAAQLDTYAGRVQQMANAWDNVKEAIGKAIVNNPIVIKGLRDMAEGMNQLDAGATKSDFSLTGLIAKVRQFGLMPIVSDVDLQRLELLAAYFESAADEANQLTAAIAKIPKVPSAPVVTKVDDSAGIALDKAFARAKKDNAEVQKQLDDLHKKTLAAFEQWAKAGEKAAAAWKPAMAASQQVAEGFADVTVEVIDLETAIGESDRVAAGFNRDGTLIVGTLDEMSKKAKETEAAFRKVFGVTAGLSLSLPTGQLSKDLRTATTEVSSFSNALKNIFAGDFSGGFSKLGDAFKSAIDPAKILNTAIGNLMSGGISALLGLATKGVTSIFKKLFGDPEKEVNPIRQAFVDMHGGLFALAEEARRAGTNLDAMLNARTVEQYNRAVKALQERLDAMTDADAAAKRTQEAAWEKLNAAAKKYGFTIDELGPAWARQELEKKAMELFEDYQLLIAAGVDMDVIIKRMGASFVDYVHTAARAGVEIPESMRPIIERMIELGLFLDENGEKVTDITQLGITFEKTMTQNFKDLIEEIKKMTKAIREGLGLPLDEATGHADDLHRSIDGIPRDIKITVTWEEIGGPPSGNRGGSPGEGGTPPAAARGGIVTPTGLIPAQYLAGGGVVGSSWSAWWGKPKGTDTVPAWLTPGEVVLSQRSQRDLLQGKTAAPAPVHVTANVFVEKDGTASLMTDDAAFNRRVQEALKSGSVVVPSRQVVQQM